MQGGSRRIKVIPLQALRVPGGWGSQISSQSVHEGGKDDINYAPAAFTQQKLFLVLTSVRGWVNPRDMVRPKGFGQRYSSTKKKGGLALKKVSKSVTVDLFYQQATVTHFASVWY